MLDATLFFVYADLVVDPILGENMVSERVTGKCMSLNLKVGMSAVELAAELRSAADALEREPGFTLNEVGISGSIVEFDLVSNEDAAA